MFTGIVRELGSVERLEARGAGVRLTVRAPETTAAASLGDSVAVSGVCLTAVSAGNGVLEFDVVEETLRRTTLGRLAARARVNVEPSLRAGDPLGGHFVQGHVDAVGRIERADGEGLAVAAGPEILRYCVEKGSIAVDGVSLTISRVDQSSFAVALVPHTRAVTTLGAAGVGDEVNLEADVLAKHVERLLEARSG